MRFATATALGLLLLAGTGCLVPQEIEEAEPQREGNAPPRIVQRAPALSDVITQNGCTQGIPFSLEAIEDFDRGDDLEVRWFVNYGPDATEPLARTTIPASPEMRDGIRSPPGDTWTFQPNAWGPGTVIVEAVVSDDFDPEPAAEPRGR